METLSIDPQTADLREMIERGTHLHGHLGPFLVAGIRMGLLALSLLESPGYFGLRARSEAGRQTPLSCLNDGVQIGSGCTTGKGNLEIVEGSSPRVRFETESRGFVIELRDEIVDSFRDVDPIVRAHEIESLSVEDLFTWTNSPSR